MKPIRVVEMDFQLNQIHSRFNNRSEKVEFMYNKDLQARVERVLPKFKKALGLNKDITELEVESGNTESNWTLSSGLRFWAWARAFN